MSPGQVSKRVAAERLAWIERMLQEIRALPLHNREAFLSDNRNVWAAESCLRRALEALLDLGRHILAKGFAVGVAEYKEIALRSHEAGILSNEEAELLRKLAGYCNRLVHFYHDVQTEELFTLCAQNLEDIEKLAASYRHWLQAHPEQVDDSL